MFPTTIPPGKPVLMVAYIYASFSGGAQLDSMTFMNGHQEPASAPLMAKIVPVTMTGMADVHGVHDHKERPFSANGDTADVTASPVMMVASMVTGFKLSANRPVGNWTTKYATW